MIVATGHEREAIERLEDIVRDELNVHELRFVSEADELGQIEIKPNYRTLGPRFGKQMPMVAAAVAGLDPAPRRHGAARGAPPWRSPSAAASTRSAAEDLLISMKPLEGYQVEREGSHAVALEIEIDDAAAHRGMGARHRARACRTRRQAAGLAGLRPHPPHARRRLRAARTPPAPTRPTSPTRRWPRRSSYEPLEASRSMIDDRPLRIGVALAG